MIIEDNKIKGPPEDSSDETNRADDWSMDDSKAKTEYEISSSEINLNPYDNDLSNKAEKLAELEMGIKKRKKELQKISGLIDEEKKKLYELKEQSRTKQIELEDLILKIWKKKEKAGDSEESSTQNESGDETVNRIYMDEMELKFLFREIDHYIDNVYLDSGTAYKKKIASIKDINPVTLDFFRTKDRIDNGILIFQYLIFFARDIKFSSVDIQSLKNHYFQFKDALLYFFSFLEEADVKKAIYREFESNSGGKQKENFEQKIVQIQEMAKTRIVETDKISIENFFELFDILKEFMLFWFETRNFNINKIRKSDIYIYNLLKHLLSLNKQS